MKNFNYEFNKDIIYKEVKSSDGQDTTIIMAHNTQNGEMYEFNDVASEIFVMMHQGTPTQKIYDNLCKEYEIAVEEIADDVEQFFNRILDLGIIKII